MFHLNIHAENAEDLKKKVAELNTALTGDRTLKMSITMPSLPSEDKGNGTKQEALPVQRSKDVVQPPPKKEKVEKANPVVEKSAETGPVQSVFGGEPSKPVEESKSEKKADKITRDQIADELRSVIAKCGPNAARDMMQDFGAPHLQKIDEKDFQKFIDLCQKTVKEKSKK